MRKAGLYLDGERFEVVRFVVTRKREHGLSDASLTGTVLLPPSGKLPEGLFSVQPTRVRYRGMSGPFYLEADVNGATMSLSLRGLAAGRVKWAAT